MQRIIAANRGVVDNYNFYWHIDGGSAFPREATWELSMLPRVIVLASPLIVFSSLESERVAEVFCSRGVSKYIIREDKCHEPCATKIPILPLSPLSRMIFIAGERRAFVSRARREQEVFRCAIIFRD